MPPVARQLSARPPRVRTLPSLSDPVASSRSRLPQCVRLSSHDVLQELEEAVKEIGPNDLAYYQAAMDALHRQANDGGSASAAR